MSSVVLFSGGLDSAVLLALQRARDDVVWPVHVRSGLAWEEAEAHAIGRLLDAAPFAGRIGRLATIAVDMRDVYPADHWAVTGTPPAYDTPDEDVYLDGRNIILLSKAAVLAARLGASRVALGPLQGNPFPDATPQFFEAFGRGLSLGLDYPLALETPLAHLHKEDVVKLGLELGVPLALTLSCMSPRGGIHCNRCSKCRERRDAFRAAGVTDETTYDGAAS
jgi:7-cyano-7-deazaguanine synthase